MRFRDTAQRTLVCKTLFDIIDVHEVWRPEGPTENLETWLKKYGGSLSTSQAALYEIALGIWNGSGGMPFVEMLSRLEEQHLKALGSLLIALADGPDQLDAWVNVWGMPDAITV